MWRFPVRLTTSAQRDVVFDAVGVHLVVGPIDTHLVDNSITLTRLWKRRWHTSKLTDVSMNNKFQVLPMSLISPWKHRSKKAQTRLPITQNPRSISKPREPLSGYIPSYVLIILCFSQNYGPWDRTRGVTMGESSGKYYLRMKVRNPRIYAQWCDVWSSNVYNVSLQCVIILRK